MQSAAPAAGSTTSAPDYSGDCLLGANGVDVEVGIGNPTQSCAQWITDLAGTGLNWYPVSQLVVPGYAGTADQEAMQEACDLTSGGEELFVEDAGGMAYGNSICSQEEQNGWTPEGSPGPLAAQAQQAADQAASAAASVSAAASQASADADAQNQAASDLTALQQVSYSSDLSSISRDVSTTKAGLGTVKSDAANGQGSYCYNVNTVAYDANAVSYDANGVSYDLNGLTNDISTARSDISTLQGDLANLQGMGLAAPSGAQSAIQSAQGEIGNAVSTANADISTENGYVADAFSVANSLATGSCNGSGPGSPPSPIAGIS